MLRFEHTTKTLVEYFYYMYPSYARKVMKQHTRKGR